MSLFTRDDQLAVERAAPADLDGVAERFDVAWLAQQAMVEFLAALGRPLQKLRRAVDRDAFFVAGDQKRDRSLSVFLRLAAARAQVIEHGRHRASNAAFHVDRATAVKFGAVRFTGKR